ncbi:hypothetical protein ACFY2M_27695 [Streptomyces sp. NPDC001276]|uniref:hypothetical protein n=1 Tax=Streptomyces sp. NPDC001276 TaxID=3364555 RepID=UPI0036A3A41E
MAWDTGWAAMKALLQELEGRLRPASEHRVGRVRLFLGADALSDLYDTEYLSEAERSRPWLTVVPVTGGTPGEGVYDRLARAVTRSRPPVAGRALLAGPPAMVQTVTAALTRAGLPADHVRHDPLPAGPRDLPGSVGDFGSAGTRMFQGQSIPA